MEQYALDFLANGATEKDILANGGNAQLVGSDPDFYIWNSITQVRTAADATTQEGQSNVLAVPLWVMALAVSEALELCSDIDMTDWFVVDKMLHAQTISYTLENARNAGFGEEDDGPTEWTAVLHFAHDLGVWARAHRSDDPHPYTIYEEDAISIDNERFTAPLQCLNQWHIEAFAVSRDVRSWLLCHWLLHPLAPAFDVDDDSDAAIVAQLITNTAKETFPALAASSPHGAMAAAKLLAIKLPWQLVRVDGTLAARTEYVDMLGRWANVANRPAVVQQQFGNALTQAWEELEGWVAELDAPFVESVRLAAALLDDDRVSVELFSRLDRTIVQFADAWSDDRKPQENVEYLISEVMRGRAAPAKPRLVWRPQTTRQPGFMLYNRPWSNTTCSLTLVSWWPSNWFMTPASPRQSGGCAARRGSRTPPCQRA